MPPTPTPDSSNSSTHSPDMPLEAGGEKPIRYARGPKSPLTPVTDTTMHYRKAHASNVSASISSLSTPARPNSRANHHVESAFVRAETEKHIASALVGRRLSSDDLVEQAFGSIVSYPLAARILLVLLRHKLIEVQLEKPNEQSPVLPMNQLWVEACVEAVTGAQSRLLGKPGGHRYKWSWTGLITARRTFGEREGAQLLNVLGAIGYAIAVKLDPQFAKKYQYRNRFALLLKKGAFRGYDGQDSRPDLIGLPIDAFQPRTPTNEDTYVDVVSPSEIFDGLPAQSQPFGTPIVLQGKDNEKRQSGVPTSSAIDEVKRDLEAMLTTVSKLSDYSIPPASLYSTVDRSSINWAALVATGEVKHKEPTDSIRQEHIYMEMQRLSQPYLRFVPGFSATHSEVAFLRADALGTEECRLKNSVGWGVLDIVRLAIGFAVADDTLLGVHPFFELEKTATDVDLSKLPEDLLTPHSAQGHTPTQSQSLPQPLASDASSASVGSKRKATTELQAAGKRAKSQQESKARRAAFLNIPHAEDPSKKTRFFLDYLADNRGGLVGRMTRVWCAYQEVLSEQDARDLVREEDVSDALSALKKHGRAFVGPYAIKFQNVDTSSASYTEGICSVIKAKAEAEPEDSRFVLLPRMTYEGDSVLEAVRCLTKEVVPKSVLPHLSDRREFITVSLYKRTLAHYKSIEEVGRALYNAFEAILWLDKHGIVHRDISNGNILLAAEEPTSFNGPRMAKADGNDIILCRRQPDQVKDVHGLLHDLDMAYLRPKVHESVKQESLPKPTRSWKDAFRSKYNKVEESGNAANSDYNHAKFRTGTPPYMAIDILLGKHYHLVTHDAESLFYVLYLFPFGAHHPPPTPVYPQELKQDPIFYPPDITKWVKGTDFKDLASAKVVFFKEETDDGQLWLNEITDGNNIHHLWPGPDPPEGMEYWMNIVEALHKHLFSTNKIDVRAMADDMKELSEKLPL